MLIETYYPLITALSSMFISQLIKLIYFYFVDKKLNLARLQTAGGLPSSHSAMVISLTTALAIQYGLASPYFYISACFALIVIHDATGIRHSVGLHAKQLNDIAQSKINNEDVGHTKFEVVIGCLVGMTCALILGCCL